MIIRPPIGFKIQVEAKAQEGLDCLSDAMPRLAAWWPGVCERLKVTAHIEGQQFPDGRWAMQIPGSPNYGIPTIAIRYAIEGDTVTVTGLLIGVISANSPPTDDSPRDPRLRL